MSEHTELQIEDEKATVWRNMGILIIYSLCIKILILELELLKRIHMIYFSEVS